jgi:hypothetical protein
LAGNHHKGLSLGGVAMIRVQLFGGGNKYYQSWSSYTSNGRPEERKKLAAVFFKGGGPVRIVNYSGSLDAERCLLWSGKDSMKYLNKMLKSVAEIDGLIDEKEVFVREVLRGLGELTEAEMKSNETA